MAVPVKAAITHAPTHLVCPGWLLFNPASFQLKLECPAYFLSLSLASSGSRPPQILVLFHPYCQRALGASLRAPPKVSIEMARPKKGEKVRE